MERLDETDVKYWELYFSRQDLGHKGLKDYSAKCPICGDSKKKNLKRCHLFTKSTFDYSAIHCFNCGWSGNMYSFLELVSPSLFNTYKNEKRGESLSNLEFISSKYEEKDIVIVEDKLELPKVLFDLPDIFYDIEENDDYYNYLKGRCMTDEQIKLFKKVNGEIEYSGQKILLDHYIILPLWCGDKVYGFQARSIKEKRFYTFIPPENSGFKVWNWFDVNLDKPVYVFESYFDALSSGLDNITAQLGSSLALERIREATEPIFVLDNTNIDKTAREACLNHIRNGFKVMVWTKGVKMKDFNEILKLGASREKISKFILSNIDSGITAEVALKL